MPVGRREQEVHGQSGAAAEQGMHAIAVQEWAGMVGGSVTCGRIGIGSAPGQNGSTIDNQITGPDQMATHSTPDGEHEERLKRWRSCSLPAFAQLRRARNAWLANGVKRKATRQTLGAPT